MSDDATDDATFDYIVAAEEIARLFPELAHCETPEAAMVSDTMTRCVDLINTMTVPQFLVSVGVALTFNMEQT